MLFVDIQLFPLSRWVVIILSPFLYCCQTDSVYNIHFFSVGSTEENWPRTLHITSASVKAYKKTTVGSDRCSEMHVVELTI